MKFTHAALMGDIAGSETAGSAKRLHKVFNEVLAEANKMSRRDLGSPLTITLGDEFQGLCPTMNAAAALMRGLRLKFLSKNIECRFSLGLVNVQTPINPRQAWNMMGPGLSAVRERLEEKERRTSYRFSVPSPATMTLLEALGASLTAIERNWTERQFELASNSILKNLNPQSLAETLGVSQRVYYKIRSAAQLELYNQIWDAIFVSMDDLDQRFLKKT
jgi:hypothetical protein